MNRRIYTCFTSTLPAVGPDVRVVRWDVDASQPMLVNRQDIVTGMSYSTGRHSGCRPHRNVQGLAFRPSDGTPFSVEHGPNRDDEVNRLEPGANYGWDPIPGYNESVPMTDLVKFPDAILAAWSSGFPTIAPSGAGFVTGTQWGIWAESLAVAVLKDQHLRFVRLNRAGTRVVYYSIAFEGGDRLRSAVPGPDSGLYLATDVGGTGGRILRVTPSSSGMSTSDWLRFLLKRR